MISELTPIWKQFEETCSALRQALSEVPEERLCWRPGSKANTVAGIVQHILRGNLVYSRMMEGGEPGPRGQPEASPSRARLLERLEESERQVRETFDRMTPEVLPQPRADDWNPLGPPVEGPLDALWFALQIVRHTAYHLGQVNLYLLLIEGETHG